MNPVRKVVTLSQEQISHSNAVISSGPVTHSRSTMRYQSVARSLDYKEQYLVVPLYQLGVISKRSVQLTGMRPSVPLIAQ